MDFLCRCDAVRLQRIYFYRSSFNKGKRLSVKMIDRIQDFTVLFLPFHKILDEEEQTERTDTLHRLYSRSLLSRENQCCQMKTAPSEMTYVLGPRGTMNKTKYKSTLITHRGNDSAPIVVHLLRAHTHVYSAIPSARTGSLPALKCC